MIRRPKPLSRTRQNWLVALAGLLFLFLWLIQAPIAFPTKQAITIVEGTTLAGASAQLAEGQIIKLPLLFRLFVALAGGEVLAGDYWFEQPLNALTIASRLARGQFVLHPIKVTIPEGASIAAISRALRTKLTKLDKVELEKLLAEKPAENFPDTYFFPPEITAEKLVEMLHVNFRRQTVKLYPDSQLSGRDWQDVLVMSSLVEEEASDYETRRLIAGILWKRLDAGMPLQVDVARITYREKGLPEKAIVNPSLAAIKATLHPTISDFWYYLADRKGETHYAVDFEGHKKNKTKYLR